MSAWNASQSGRGSPWVTTTDGTNNAIVWVVGAQGDQRLHGYNGDTGAVVYAGGGANELMTGTRKWNSGIAARGSIYVANDNKVYTFGFPPGNAYAYANAHALVRPQPRLPHQLHSNPNSHTYSNSNPPSHTNTASYTHAYRYACTND